MKIKIMTIAALLGLLGCQGPDQFYRGTGDAGADSQPDSGIICNPDGGSTRFSDPASGWSCDGVLFLNGLFSCTCTGPGTSPPSPDPTDALCAKSKACAMENVK